MNGCDNKKYLSFEKSVETEIVNANRYILRRLKIIEKKGEIKNVILKTC